MSSANGATPAARANDRAKVRSFHHDDYPAERIAGALGEQGLRACVCLPARECASTVGQIVSSLGRLQELGVLQEIVVVDAASPDGTAQVAAAAGARVLQESELQPGYGPVLGKGDAMWRALSTLDSELVCFLDADTERFSERFATGLLGALACEPDVQFVKAHYRRPLTADTTTTDAADAHEGGGRVNHLLARPALALFYPELAGVRQPLAGEVAARRELLEKVPFVTGYGVEVGMLIDVWREVGIEGIGQVDLEVHHNRHQTLAELAPMAQTVLATVVRRVEQEGRLAPPPPAAAAVQLAPPERPPLASLATLPLGPR